jgi:molybdenum cofactor cytidylyltransferase
MREKQVAVVVLAAGGSTRMGQPKQLLEVDGQALLRRTVQTALNSDANWVLVTLGNQAQSCLNALEGLDCSLVTVGDWQHGLSRSILRALGQVQEHNSLTNSESPWYDAVLFVPCDLPQLSVEHLNALMSVYQNTNASIVASQFGEVLGVPALFDAAIWPEFEVLSGDEGARKIIRQSPERVKAIAFASGAIDLDTPQDYRAFVSGNLSHFE